MNSAATTAVTFCSTSSSAVSTPPVIKPVLMSKSVPPSPEKILNGKGILSATIDKKHQNGTKNNNKPYRRLSGSTLEGSDQSWEEVLKASAIPSSPGGPSSANSISSSTSSNHSGYTPEPPLPPVGGDLASRLSSDEGEMDGADESEKLLDCHFSTHHPRPLAFCSFGSRLMGRGYYVFDRRWDRFRFALNSMVEKHLNSQMWKKIPPAADSPMPSPAAHITTPVPASVLQPFSNPSAVYLPSAPISSRLTSSYIMTSAMLSNAAFVTSPDPSTLMSHTTAFPHVAATLSIMDSTFKAPSAVSPIPAVIPSPSHKPSKTKTSKSSKVKDLSARSDESPSNKKRKPPSSTSASPSVSLQTSLSPLSGPHKKNCVLNASSALNSYQAAPPYNSLSVHNSNNGVSPLSAKLEPSGRTSLPGGPTDLVRHMGSGGGSSDSCPLSVPSLAGDLSLASHNAVSSLPLSFDKSEGKKRKNSSSSSKACKITKMPGMNSVHRKNPPSLLAPVRDPSFQEPSGTARGWWEGEQGSAPRLAMWPRQVAQTEDHKQNGQDKDSSITRL
ncbi:hypothetical protein EI555_011778 [Monodon monoceros]|uniref:SCA7 domain-containing protein n=1 Tax=Monodon monoceros TaxID=40151 RepID=A0A4U1EP31_MONMO|nr:hypothetical protein EI555_011778 [Monodon monoceros]